jgi:hypothetical protein
MIRHNIQVRDLLELSESQRENYYQYLITRRTKYDVYLMTVYDMLEFLEEEDDLEMNTEHIDNGDNDFIQYTVNGHTSQDLCTALWEAVKENL